VTTEQDDDLRARLARLDPMPPSIPVDPSTSPRAQVLLERVMLTTEQSTDPTVAPPRWRRTAALAAAAAAVLAVGAGALVARGGDSAAPAKHRTTLALQAPPAAHPGVMSSCIRFSVDILRDMPVAFGGTVTAVSAGQVTIDVDRWFKGGSADVVTIAVPERNTSVGTVDLEEGKRYLVTATDGTVNACGFTGEATPDLEAAFEQAFAP
jgi:hypothetical protein